MNWETIEGNWLQFVGKARVKWGRLTHDTLMQIQGHKDALAGKLQEVYGYTKEQAEKAIADFQSECHGIEDKFDKTPPADNKSRKPETQASSTCCS